MKTMPQDDGLPELQATTLLAIWKLKGIGGNAVDEDQLKAELINESPENVPSAIQLLQSQGFIEIRDLKGRKAISITPLGVAILRKIEEDRLQELK
jgi:DNA-binding PadR family transcriptional regulator